MDAENVAQLITAVGSLVASLGVVYNIYLARQNAVKLEEVSKHTNGLVKTIGASMLAQGTAEGRAAGLEQGRSERRASSEE